MVQDGVFRRQNALTVFTEMLRASAIWLYGSPR
jgi:hypothetical protein